MTIQNVSSITPTASRFNDLTELRTPAPAPRLDEVTQQPLPPRFPWLSRLAQELEAASDRKPAFPPAPIIGDNLDKTA